MTVIIVFHWIFCTTAVELQQKKHKTIGESDVPQAGKNLDIKSDTGPQYY